MILHILYCLPTSVYQDFISYHNMNGYTNMTIETFGKKIRSYWKQNMKNQKEETMINMSVKHANVEKQNTQDVVLEKILDRLKNMNTPAQVNHTQGYQTHNHQQDN